MDLEVARLPPGLIPSVDAAGLLQTVQGGG